ncbi:MAG TPA: hypothetical protein VL244_05230 [Alphaproteobacteria bacterium]|nr:hypothetical protein [Alphaproteobacteria bacterium]
MTSWKIAAAFFAVALIAGPAAGRAAERVVPGGLVLDVSGKVEPPVARFAQVRAPATIEVAPDAKLTFIYYPTCRVVTLAGGTLKVGALAMEVVGGRIELDEVRTCPQQQKLAYGNVAAMVLRDVQQPYAIPARPTIVLAGDHAAEVVSGSLADGGRTVALEFKGNEAGLASGAPDLEPGLYKARLAARDGTETRFEARFKPGEHPPDILVIELQ